MALDRQSIERRDFPIARRGYEPDVVDAHLEALADGVEAIRASARRRTERLAAAASEQVRSIVEAAESSAYDLQRRAEGEARDVRREARLDAERTRSQSRDQARDLVAQVGAASARLLGQLDEVEREQSTLVDSLRTGGRRLRSELETLERALSEDERAAPSRAAEEAAAPVPLLPPEPPEPLLPEPSEPAFAEPGPAFEEPLPAAGTPDEADSESARLIALNMVLNGTPREETELYLTENFGAADRAAMLDDLYASLGG